MNSCLIYFMQICRCTFCYLCNCCVHVSQQDNKNLVFSGRTLDDNQHYNPYFRGGAIGMAQALYNEIIEYDDGTPCTASQAAKDVSTFLRWSADPHHDKRKRYLIKVSSSKFIEAKWFDYKIDMCNYKDVEDIIIRLYVRRKTKLILKLNNITVILIMQLLPYSGANLLRFEP